METFARVAISSVEVSAKPYSMKAENAASNMRLWTEFGSASAAAGFNDLFVTIIIPWLGTYRYHIHSPLMVPHGTAIS